MKGIEASQLLMTTLVLGVDSMVKRFKLGLLSESCQSHD